MRLTSFTDFALRALMRIASDTKRSYSTAEIADEFGISRNHLTKAVAVLAAAGIVETRRGAGGGAVLAKPAEQLPLGDIVAVLERGTTLVECFHPDSNACVITPSCRLKGMLSGAEKRFIEDLNRHSLADIALPVRQETRHGNQR
jgi:Rrf2 family nitric oxide-sensitive transcriptional repressor